MRRPLHVRGRVTDAETGRPITAFTLVPGYTWENDPNVWWLNDRAKELTGLSYDVLLSTEAGLRVIRIEAEGYLPETSRRLKDDEEEAVVHFALQRGSGISGVVRLPDGSPLAGAEVMLATPARPAALEQRPASRSAMGDQWIVKTRGRRAIQPAAERAAVYRRRASTTGAARCWPVRARPAGEHELTILPWGRVEGILRFGRRPAAGQKLCLALTDRREGPGQRVYWSSYATTDAQGRFTFERVVPGEVRSRGRSIDGPQYRVRRREPVGDGGGRAGGDGAA